MIHSVEIAFLFISFKRLRLEREHIRQILLDLEQLTSDTSFTLEKLFKSERNEIFGSRGGPASDKMAMSLRATSQILNKTKNFESLIYYLRTGKQQISVGVTFRKEILLSQYDGSIVF